METNFASHVLGSGMQPNDLNFQVNSAAPAQTIVPALSVVVPIYNDGYLAEPFCAELKLVFEPFFGTADLSGFLEVIFVDDGSDNDSIDLLRKLASSFSYVRVIELSRNFGQHIALSCGLTYATGEMVVTLNVDMQDPPAELPRLIEHMKKGGWDFIQAIRKVRKDPFFKCFSSRSFYSVFNKLAGFKLPENPTSIRLMNRRYVDAFNRYTEKVRFALGLEQWLGFRCDFVTIEHDKRQVGKSSYNVYKRFDMALEAIISFSDMPLKASILFGSCFALIGAVLAILFIALKLLLPGVQAGYTSIVAILLFSQGTTLMMLGVTGLYIGRILKEVQNRPLFVVRQTYNFPQKD